MLSPSPGGLPAILLRVRGSRVLGGHSGVFPHIRDTDRPKGVVSPEQDVANGMPVAIVNETFAKKYFSGVDPLAQRVIVEQLIPGTRSIGSPIEWRIIGVFHDVRNGGVRDQGFPEIAVPFWQSPGRMPIELRTAGDPAAIAKTIAAVIQTVDSDLALDQVRTMDQSRE